MDISNYKFIIAKKIKNIRISNRMTQEEFCNAIDLEISNLSNIENCKTMPSLQTMVKILNVFKLEPNEFFNFVDWEQKNVSALDIEIN